MKYATKTLLSCLLTCAFPILLAIAAGAQNTVTPGDLMTERPTLLSLGFEWRIAGDDNRNAKVEVSYRAKGETKWRDALPLVRLQGEKVGAAGDDGEGGGGGGRRGGAGANIEGGAVVARPGPGHPDPFHYVAPNMFAGSILNLEPGTQYECRFVMTDPDGIKGVAMKTVMVSTRPEPMPATDGKVYHVYPIDWKGTKEEPAFTGLSEAYYQGAASSDYENSYPPRVVPGDVIMMHAGVYKSDRFHYLNGLPHHDYLALGTLFDGTYYLTASGTAEKPIVIKNAGDGEVIFDGNGAQTLFNLMAANYNYFEGITFRNANLVFLLGIHNIIGSNGFTLKHSRLYDIGRAVQDDWSGSKDFYIADNIFIGRHDPAKMMGWSGGEWTKFPGFPEMLGGPEGSEYAVKVYGQGHVIAYNYAANWHDAFDIATYGMPDGTLDTPPRELADRIPVSIDMYNNDMYNMGDNCIEADGGAHNIRVFKNRCYNSVGGALSATPLVGGPVYFYQNVVYNTSTSGITKYGTSAGILTYQNTFFGVVRSNSVPNIHFRNNLIVGGTTRDAIYGISTPTNYSTSDYNGFRPFDKAENSFEWNSPADGVMVDYGKPTTRHYKTLAEYSAATGQDKHSVMIDYDVFVKASPVDRQDIQRLYSPEDYDFQLKPGSAAIDAGTSLPTITDGFTGKGPDLGAYELGKPLPHYGPRTAPPGVTPNDAKLRSVMGPPSQ
jgi:hypothetical protein